MQSYNHSEYEYILTPDEDSTLLVYDAMSIDKYHSSDSLRVTLDCNEDGTSKLLPNVYTHTHNTPSSSRLNSLPVHTYTQHTIIQ